jgi:hypothetical protein
MAEQKPPQQQAATSAQPGQQQAQAGQIDPQHLEAAAQIGAEARRAGLDAGTLFRVVGLLQKYGPTIAQIAQEFGGLFGAQAPGAQAAPKR